MYKKPNLSLYIHIPWCVKKCFYCDFHSITNNRNLEKKYIKSLIQDFKNDIKLINNRTINTIFIGGGTPNILSNNSLSILLKKIKKKIKIKKKTEITIETNPKNITIKQIKKFQKLGINRISIGIQTFNNNLLKKIGRDHNSNNIIEFVKKIQNIKKKNINFDIIYGLPKQTLKQALSDIKQAIKLKPKHISWYQLNIEKNTFFYKKKIQLPNENIIMKITQKGEKILKKNGYKQYEISSYTKRNYECKHNLNYWNFGDYLGIGSGAHSKITKNNGDIYRFEKNKNIINYINGEFIIKKKKISKKKKIFEYFMNKFRLLKPIKYKKFTEQTNIKFKKIKKKIKKLISKKYIKNNGIYCKTTKKGRLFLNSILTILL
ncbi:radical SAM family heme chaperone HemW [Buchnera aphidicola (Mollitrichosiphum nigrofasciatum)]|uniref:radical SAM family heme chaperone HemW n=1 Tax=Buchnera aphidicola TaxID=9 RepID=UPI0031B7EC86